MTILEGESEISFLHLFKVKDVGQRHSLSTGVQNHGQGCHLTQGGVMIHTQGQGAPRSDPVFEIVRITCIVVRLQQHIQQPGREDWSRRRKRRPLSRRFVQGPLSSLEVFLLGILCQAVIDWRQILLPYYFTDL